MYYGINQPDWSLVMTSLSTPWNVGDPLGLPHYEYIGIATTEHEYHYCLLTHSMMQWGGTWGITYIPSG